MRCIYIYIYAVSKSAFRFLPIPPQYVFGNKTEHAPSGRTS